MSNNNLFRILKNGSAYNALIPKSTCEKVSFGKGDTHFSIEMIVKQALQHNKQVEKLAPKLKAESGAGTLQEICYRVHQFLYWHLKYKADGEAQLLRSPACAWQQRKDGIDCKSYSIFASAILLQLGIKHYIRKIKQPTHNPEHYSHVYVIVPKNQDTGNLDKGYYTIDGTLQHITEPIYTHKKDFFMDRLPHYGLNGANKGLGNSFDFENVFNNLNFSNISFGSLCTDRNSSYTTTRFNDNIAKIFNYFFEIIDQYNNAIASKNYKRVGEIIAEFEGKSYAMYQAFTSNRNKDWNDCTDDKLVKTIRFVAYKINGVLLDALKAHYETFFNISQTNNSYTFPENKIIKDQFDGQTYAHITTGRDIVNIPIQVTLPTPKFEEIKQFLVTEELKNVLEEDYKNVKENPHNLNVSSFIQQIISTAPTILSFTNGSDNNGQNVYDQNNQNIKPQTQEAGFGVLGWVLVLGGLGYAFTKMKDKGVLAKTTKK